MNFSKIISYLEPYSEILARIPKTVQMKISDIRIQVNRPIMLCDRNGMMYLNRDGTVFGAPAANSTRVSQAEVDFIFRRLCGYAVYSHMEEIKHGFVSTDSGLRVGLIGTIVSERGKVRAMREITGLCIRIPREIHGCADPVLRELQDLSGGLLLAGAPSSGKTTLLRDLARSLGNTVKRVVVLDERFELLTDGFDLGLGTTVLQGGQKSAGLSHAMRCLSPEYILCDELGDADLPAVQASVFAGVSLIATVHAGSETDLKKRPLCRALLETGAFQHVSLLRFGEIRIRKVRDIL